jgi:hypothetical protein
LKVRSSRYQAAVPGIVRRARNTSVIYHARASGKPARELRIIHGNTTPSSLYKREIGLLFNPELADPTPDGMVRCNFEGEHDG